MATKKVTYKEPKNYFTPEMLKTAKEWDEKHSASAKRSNPKNTKSSGAKKK